MWDPYNDFETYVLDNGLTLHAQQWPGRQWECMEFIIHSGAKDDPRDLEGIAHFVEHLVGDNIPGLTHEEVHDFFEEHGTKPYFGGTGYLSTRYQFAVDLGILSKSLEIFGSMLLSARLQKKFEHHRSVITQEFSRKYPNLYMYKFWRKCAAIIYPDHPRLSSYRDSLGDFDSINRIGLADMQNFYDQYYVPQNISIVAVGGVTPQELLDLLQASPFSQSKAGKRNPMAMAKDVVARPAVNKEVFSYSTITNQPISPSLSLISVLPGIIPSTVSRVFINLIRDILMERIRKQKGWAYDVSSDLSWYQDCREMSLSIPSFASDALAVIIDEVNDCLQTNDRFIEAFEKNKNHLIANLRFVDLSGQKLAEYSGQDLAYYQRIKSVSEALSAYQAVTLEDMYEMLTYLQPENRFTLLMQP